MKKDDVIENLPPKMAVIAEHIQKMNTMKYVGNARQCGMLAGIELMHDKNLKIPFDSTLLMAGGICQTARKYGLIVRNIGDVIIFYAAAGKYGTADRRNAEYTGTSNAGSF